MGTPSKTVDGAAFKGIHHVVSTFRIVIATDTNTAQRLVATLAPFGYDLIILSTENDAAESIGILPPDMVIVSDNPPSLDAVRLLRAIRTTRGIEELPVMLLQPVAKNEAVDLRAYQAGADDVLPIDTPDVAVRARVRVLLRLSTYRRRLQNEKRRLELKVAERTRELFEITLATVAALEKATELTDEETGHHMLRVAGYSALLAGEIGLGPEMIERIRLYAPLHDVGKVGVPHEILKKQGVLTRDEFEQMKRHTVYGYDLLTAARADEVARNIALSHHERIDGSGYPHGKKGTEIPVEARIVAVADVFDALTMKRCYKDAMEPSLASRTITVDLADRFDPKVVAAFSSRWDDIEKIWESFRPSPSQMLMRQ
jgi:putative two-component system response regulator